jgi:hypothetical protein
MLNFNLQEIDNRYDNLSEALKNVLDSEIYADSIIKIAVKNHIDEERQLIIMRLVSYLVLGLLHPTDLAREISESTKIDLRIAEEITKEIQFKILRPIADELIKTHGFHMEESGPTHNQTLPAHTVPIIEKSNQKNPPQINKEPIERIDASLSINTTPKVERVAPAILHDHEGNVNQDESGYSGGLVRPSFYEVPGNTSNEQETDSPQARLEIGNQRPIVQPTTKVGKENANIVHYSAPATTDDPFSNQTPQTPNQENNIEHEDIPDSNIVNLKDLPK